MTRMRLLVVSVAPAVLVAACSGTAGNVPNTDAPAAAATTTTATSTTIPALGPELLVNGSFEDGDPNPNGWDLSAAETGQVVSWLQDESSGGRFLRMSASVREDASWPNLMTTAEFEVEPGTSYLVTLNARTDGLGLLFLSLFFKDDAGVEFVAKGPPILNVTNLEWSLVQSEITAPEGAVTAGLRLRLALNPQITDVASLSLDINDVSVGEVLE